jgi:hypothetical protein
VVPQGYSRLYGIASGLEVIQGKSALVDMQFRRVLPFVSLVLISCGFAGVVRGTNDI